MEAKLVSRSIIIPAYNEQHRIGKTLKKYADYFEKKYPGDNEIIVVLNGCRDKTLEVVKEYEKSHINIRHLDLKQAGKGLAVIEGFKASNGLVIGYTDADGSTRAEIFDRLFLSIEKDGVDCAIGSRWLKDSIVDPQPLRRLIMSRVFNAIVSLYFRLGIKDTQCGAKVAKRDAITKILPDLILTDLAIDVNFLFALKRIGATIKEVAIEWEDDRGSVINGRAPIMMFLSISKLRLLYSPLAFLYPAAHPVSNAIRKAISK